MTTDRARRLSTAFTSGIVPLALLTAVMIGLGFLITRVLVRVWLFTVEDGAVRALVAARTPAWDRVTELVSLVAFTPAVVIATVVAGGAMRIAYHRWHETLFLAAAVLGQGVTYKVTAWVVARGRPPVLELDVFPPMRSFFSGHAAAAVALYGGIAVVLALHSRRRPRTAGWWAMLLVVPVAVAVSRVYRGMHYPSDVAASFLAGSGSLWISQRAIRAPAERRGRRAP